MDRLIYTAMTGASQTLSRQAAVAHNLANVSSTGYRAEENRLMAVPVVSQAVQKGLPTRAFAIHASTGSDFSSGPMMSTGRATDIAIQGPGWFAVQLPDGSEAYTRNGSFEISENGVLQTHNGLPVQGDGGPITIPPEVQISVGRDGTLSAIPETGARNAVNTIGRLKLVNPNAADLVRGDDGYFRLRDGGGAALDESVKVVSGNLEGSNVNAAEQMVTMISLARQFEMQMKAISSAEANDRAATQVMASL